MGLYGLDGVIFRITCVLLIWLQSNQVLCGSSNRQLNSDGFAQNDEPSGPDLMAEKSSIDLVQSLYNYSQARNWKLNDHEFGQITAVDINKRGNIVIFQRGNHVWGGL